MSRSRSTSASVPARDLIAREQTFFQRELLNRAVQVRFRLVLLCLVMGALDLAFNLLPGAWQLLMGGSLLMLLVNELVARWNRRGAADERHLWAMQCLDTLMLGILVATFGANGYMGIPFVIFMATAYAMGHARAAWVQLALGCAMYPIARAIGTHALDGAMSAPLIVLETLLMGALGWLSMQTPLRYMIRLRRARWALAELSSGDFSVRLPTRALDDIGFLGVSFNVTAETLGTAVRSLEDEVKERARAEESMRVARHEATQMAHRMAAVAEAAAGVLAADSARALRDVLREACEHVLDMQDFALALLDARSGTLRLLGDSQEEDHVAPIPSHGDLRCVIDDRHTRVCDEVCDPLTAHGPPAHGTMMRTPVLIGHDVVGVLAICSSHHEAYGAADIAVFEALAALAATALRNILLVDELRSSREALSHQAHHDGLTGLANRRQFRARVVQALERDEPERVAVLALDLDGFKEVNDSYGHAAGDRVLEQVSDRLLNATRGADLVARLGGDEFAILLEHVPDEGHALVVADRVLRAIAEPFPIGDRLVGVGTSIGIAFGHPAERRGDGGRSVGGGEVADGDRRRHLVDVLLHEADVALYRAKTAGKSCRVIFESSMHEEERARRQLAHDLREAVRAGTLQLLYQPIHELATGAMRGVEALVRWDHPRRGTVAPAVWHALAEESGLVVELGEWALRRACAAVASWPPVPDEATGAPVPLSLTMKVSVLQLQAPSFVAQVQAALTSSGLPASSLLLEVTEEALLHAPADARDQMQRLHHLGVRFIVDDFGMGTSSLGDLQGLAMHMLKLDRAFVAGVARGGSQTALARTILALGRALSLATIAEGVDSDAQRATLQGLGCAFGQGTCFSRPVPDAAIVQLIVGEGAGAV